MIHHFACTYVIGVIIKFLIIMNVIYIKMIDEWLINTFTISIKLVGYFETRANSVYK